MRRRKAGQITYYYYYYLLEYHYSLGNLEAHLEVAKLVNGGLQQVPWLTLLPLLAHQECQVV